MAAPTPARSFGKTNPVAVPVLRSTPLPTPT
jgi:hypothetical protein